MQQLDGFSARLLKLEHEYQRIASTSSSWDMNRPSASQGYSAYQNPMRTYNNYKYTHVHVQDEPTSASINNSPVYNPYPTDSLPTSINKHLRVHSQMRPSTLCTPTCLPIQTTSNKVSVSPSEIINKGALLPVDVVLKKYPKLKGSSRAGELALKHAMEAFFGEEVLIKCTVKGCRNLPALPCRELQQLKQVVFSRVPQFWSNPADFDQDVWASCKGLRSRNQRKVEE